MLSSAAHVEFKVGLTKLLDTPFTKLHMYTFLRTYYITKDDKTVPINKSKLSSPRGVGSFLNQAK